MSISRIEVEARVFIKGRNLTKWPLSLETFAGKLCLDKLVKIKYCNDLPDEIGAYTRETDKYYYVIVNGDHPPQRQRFSGSHEMSHLHLGHEGLSIHAWNHTDTFEEIENMEADAFAAAILMPADKMYFLAECYKDVWVLLDKVQQYFDVSLSAAARRITELSIFEGAIILKHGYKKCFGYKSPGFYDGTEIQDVYCKTLPSGKKLHIVISENYSQLINMGIS